MRGGRRPGAGRPTGTQIDPRLKREMINARIPRFLIDEIMRERKTSGTSTGRIIEQALIQFFDLDTAPNE